MCDKILIILSGIPINQTQLFETPCEDSNGLSACFRYDSSFKYKLETYCFLNHCEDLHEIYKKVIVIQYAGDPFKLSEYQNYLRTVSKYINEKKQQGITDYFPNKSYYMPTNVEKPFFYLDPTDAESYIESFETEFGLYKYLFISYTYSESDLQRRLTGIIDELDFSGELRFVSNLSNKNRYSRAFVSATTNRGYVCEAKSNRGENYIFQDLITHHNLNYSIRRHDNDFIQNIKLSTLKSKAQKLKIPKPEDMIDEKEYYIAAINIKYRIPFMLTGLTGTGKTYFVKEVLSKLHINDFANLNCANYNDNLLESAIFGHKKGSFTGAYQDHKGLVELYDVLFLDEVGKFNNEAQAKILKFVDEKKYYKVGSTKEETSNTLLIFSTNQDLKRMCEDKDFLEDLYYRIATTIIQLPSFNELFSSRKDNIIKQIIKECNIDLKQKQVNMRINESYLNKQLKKDAFDFIKFDYHWPGNIREIKKTIEKVFLYSENTSITKAELRNYINFQFKKTPIDPFDFRYEDIKDKSADALIDKFQSQMVILALENNDNIKSAAAKAIGISAQKFGQWLKKVKNK